MINEDLQQLSTVDSAEGSSYNYYRLSVDKLKDQLSNFGLTPNQSKVYTFLGKWGSKTALEVSKALQLPRTETYHLLTTLQNRGIISATFEHPTRFSALPLDKAIWVLVNTERERVNNLEKQKQELEELWNNIPDFQSSGTDKKEEKFQMLQGTNQINSKIKEMITNTKSEFMILGCEKDFLRFYHADLLSSLSNLKIKVKLLTSSSEKTMYIFDDIDKSCVKRMSGKIKDHLCFIIKDDNEMLFFMKNASQTSQNVVAMWSDSISMIYLMKFSFDSIWSKSKSIDS